MDFSSTRSAPQQPASLKDRSGRVINNLRISVTDRCNFRCVYCMPAEGLQWLPRAEIMTFEEIVELSKIFIGLGIEKVRLTGGEPLVRKGLPDLVRMLSRLPGLRDLGLTTNGYFLEEQAQALSEAGLKRINVSLDSLVRETFDRMARRAAFDRVMKGLDAAGKFFQGPVKVNAVLIRGLNDSEVFRFAELARERNFEIRFIEYMPLDADRQWSMEKLMSGEEARRAIDSRYPLVRDPAGDPHAPSADWVFADGAGGKIGFINSVTEPFCGQCNRIRLTADGKLRTCLFSVGESDLLALLRGGRGAAEIASIIRTAVWDKEPGHRINQPGFEHASRSMSQIGG